MISPTVRALIGAPYLSHGNDPATGLDCFTLVARVLADDHGIDLRGHARSYSDSMSDNSAVLERVAKSGNWRRVPHERAVSGDVVLFTIAGSPRHIGIMVAPGRFAHARPGSGVTVEALDSTQWSKRIAGVWRHEP
jgi:cell wall-associated NlpC family hydrolase